LDGFAVRADDTMGGTKRSPKALALNSEILGKPKGDRASSDRQRPHGPELLPDLSESLNPAKAIAEMMKLIVLHR
jgi:hypothetical protein